MNELFAEGSIISLNPNTTPEESSVYYRSLVELNAMYDIKQGQKNEIEKQVQIACFDLKQNETEKFRLDKIIMRLEKKLSNQTINSTELMELQTTRVNRTIIETEW